MSLPLSPRFGSSSLHRVEGRTENTRYFTPLFIGFLLLPWSSPVPCEQTNSRHGEEGEVEDVTDVLSRCDAAAGMRRNDAVIRNPIHTNIARLFFLWPRERWGRRVCVSQREVRKHKTGVRRPGNLFP